MITKTTLRNLAATVGQELTYTLTVVNDDSVAEQIQRAFPESKVVKALNTMTASVMVEPSSVPGSHNAFIAGNDPEAKAAVVGLLEHGPPKRPTLATALT